MLKNEQPIPELFAEMTQAMVDRLSRKHLDRLWRLDRRAKRIVDKNLNNYRLLGLIELMFPRARVIHCRRDPMAIGLSCFALPLSTTLHPYTTDLRNLGLYSNEYIKLMAHWKNVLDLSMLDVQYETLVSEPERIAREMIAFVGLEWDDQCLAFHKTSRAVATASYHQVREQVYTSAMNRYDRFRAHLKPLRDALSEESL